MKKQLILSHPFPSVSEFWQIYTPIYNHHPNQDTGHFHPCPKFPSRHQLEHTELIYGDRNQSSGCLGNDCKEAQETFWGDGDDLHLDVSGYTYQHWFLYIKWVYLVVYMLHINKLNWKISIGVKALVILPTPTYSPSLKHFQFSWAHGDPFLSCLTALRIHAVHLAIHLVFLCDNFIVI